MRFGPFPNEVCRTSHRRRGRILDWSERCRPRELPESGADGRLVAPEDSNLYPITQSHRPAPVAATSDEHGTGSDRCGLRHRGRVRAGVIVNRFPSARRPHSHRTCVTEVAGAYPPSGAVTFGLRPDERARLLRRLALACNREKTVAHKKAQCCGAGATGVSGRNE